MPTGIALERNEDVVRCTDAHGNTLFADSASHLQQGVLRLLGITLDDFVAALELTAAADTEETVRSFARGLTAVRGLDDLARRGAERSTSVGPGLDGELWLSWIAKAPEHGIVLDHGGELGRLARPGLGGWVPEHEPPVYEESYFEGDDPTGVYGDYDADAKWRIEKARRQVAELERLTALRGNSALDVGSGYGYFRVALEERGIRHVGVDVSRHAIRAAERKYGFDTLEGTLSSHLERLAGRFDLVTLWDVIEHVPEPDALLADAVSCLRPGGVVAIRTPSISCPEAELLGPHYHSLQRPHLVYFSPASLRRAACRAGLRELELRTTSHFLCGFAGDARVAEWAAAERGSDIIAAFAKPDSAADGRG